jgi:hypothetical protein
MFITRLGQGQFWIKDKPKKPKVSIFLGEFDVEKNSLLKEIDILLIGLQKQISNLPENVFLINYPGEYDVKDVMIRGIQDGNYIIYTIDLFGEKIVYLEGLKNASIDDQKLEQLGEVHVLITAINGNDLDPKSAVKIVNRIEPRLVIPINYKQEDLSQFLKILGVEHQPEEDSLHIQANTLPEEGLMVRILKNS